MCPEGAATYAAYKQSLADGRVEARATCRAVQLRHRSQISDAAGSNANARPPQADRLFAVQRGISFFTNDLFPYAGRDKNNNDIAGEDNERPTWLR